MEEQVKKLFIGIDNGSSGSYTIINECGELICFEHVPTFKIKKWATSNNKQGHITVIDVNTLEQMLSKYIKSIDKENIYCFIERPAVGFSGWSIWTSLSGIVAWVSVQYALLNLGIKYDTIDSKQWQKYLIPQALGKKDKSKPMKRGDRNKYLKIESDKLAKELYPDIELKNSGDGDSINIAHYLYLRESNKL